MEFMFFFDISTGMSILCCQYDLGFDPFLVGNGFHNFFLFFFNLFVYLYVICELFMYIFLVISSIIRE